MSQRMTDERLGEIERALWGSEGVMVNHCRKLLLALKAERQEVERLRKQNGQLRKRAAQDDIDLVRRNNQRVIDANERAKIFEDACACMTEKHEAAKRKLARLVDGLEAVIDTAIRQDDFPDIDRLQALIKEAQATGEGK